MLELLAQEDCETYCKKLWGWVYNISGHGGLDPYYERFIKMINRVFNSPIFSKLLETKSIEQYIHEIKHNESEQW
jgi:hypothetical protein